MRYLLIVLLCACSSPSEDPAPIQKDEIKDADGNVYKAIDIDGTLWLSRDLVTTHYRNGDEILSYPTGFYSWDEAADPRGVCPSGWRVPTVADWEKVDIEELNATFSGYWDKTGMLFLDGEYSYWWTVTKEIGSPQMVVFDGIDAYTGSFETKHGLCLRCVK